MKETISALMDGELEGTAAARTIEALARGEEARTWRTYHLISDAMRDTPLLSADFVARVASRLEAEPTVLAPRRLRSEPRSWTRIPAALAAGLAALGLVGYLAFAPTAEGPLQQPLAKAPQAAPAAVASSAPRKPASIPLPLATPDYLLAHQGFSPRVSLQGMAPYARTVSDQANERRR